MVTDDSLLYQKLVLYSAELSNLV